MEKISGDSNWKMMIRREAKGITLLRALTCDQKAILPETLFGQPVIALGARALSPIPPLEGGEEVLMCCGPVAEGEWNNCELRDITLPKHLKRVGDSAFLNCRSVTTMRLHDGVEEWGRSSLANCWSLNRFFLTRVGEQGPSLANIVTELSGKLDITVYNTDGTTTRVIFPEYEETEEEDFISQVIQFDYHISGAGYLHHQCLQQKLLHLKSFDNLWLGYLQKNFEPSTALQLAFWRVRYPVDLSEGAARNYWDYLCKEARSAVIWLLSEGDTTDLCFLLERTAPDRETLAAACTQARDSRQTEALALLLEERRKRPLAVAEKTFEL